MSKKQQKRAILYLRQSTYREESISLELQEAAGREHCKKHGYKVVGVEADPGISGRTWNRPAVKRVMSAIEDHEADVIVLWKWSRLSRSRRDWALAVDRVELAGGLIESATEPLDVATSAGRLARGMMVEFAAFESERIGDVWKEAHARRVKSGRPANGKARWGYLYDSEQKLHVPDPDLKGVVEQTYRRYIAGESIYSLVKWLNDSGYHTAPGYGQADSKRLWSDRILRRTMASGFPAGLFLSHGELLEGAHEAIIDEATWEAFQVAMKTRKVAGQKPRSKYLLSGMVRCAQCGHSMTAGMFGAGRTPKFRCKGASDYRLHSGGYVSESVLIEEVKAWIAEQDFAPQDAEYGQTHSGEETLSRKFAELDQVNARILKLSEQLVEELIPADVYRDMIAKVSARREELDREILGIRVRQREDDASQIQADVLRDWDVLPLENLRVLLKQIIEVVVVTPGRPRASVQVKGLSALGD